MSHEHHKTTPPPRHSHYRDIEGISLSPSDEGSKVHTFGRGATFGSRDGDTGPWDGDSTGTRHFQMLVQGSVGDAITGRRHGEIDGLRVHSAGDSVFVEGVTSDGRTRRGGFVLARETWNRFAAKVRLGKSEAGELDGTPPGAGLREAETGEPEYGADKRSEDPQWGFDGGALIIACAICSHEFPASPAIGCPKCEEARRRPVVEMWPITPQPESVYTAYVKTGDWKITQTGRDFDSVRYKKDVATVSIDVTAPDWMQRPGWRMSPEYIDGVWYWRLVNVNRHTEYVAQAPSHRNLFISEEERSRRNAEAEFQSL